MDPEKQFNLCFYIHDIGDTVSVLPDVKHEMVQLTEAVHKFAFDIVFAPLESQLSTLHQMEVCKNMIDLSLKKKLFGLSLNMIWEEQSEKKV